MFINIMCENYNLTFLSRNKTIRYADNIARAVSKKFPMVSTTKYMGLNRSYLYESSLLNLDTKLTCARTDICKLLASNNSGKNSLATIDNLIKKVLQYKLGNCGEYSDVCMLLAYLNNIKKVSTASLITKSCEDLDHCVLYVENGNKPYIIDAWLGFADYVPNAILKYKNLYSKYFPFGKITDNNLQFKKYKCLIMHTLNSINPEESRYLRKKFDLKI